MATTMRVGDVPEWTLSDRLRKAREHADLKQTDLAELTGISRASIVNYESGKFIPRRPALAAWAMACGVSLEWLSSGDAAYGPDSGPGLGVPVTGQYGDLLPFKARQSRDAGQEAQAA